MSNKLCNKLSNKTPSYLTLRNDIYYFCYRVPASQTNKSTIIRYSLKTRDPLVARERIANLIKIVKTNKEVSLRVYDNKLCDRFTNELLSREDYLSVIKPDPECFLREIKTQTLTTSSEDLESLLYSDSESKSQLQDPSTLRRIEQYSKLTLLEKNELLSNLLDSLVSRVKEKLFSEEDEMFCWFNRVYEVYQDEAILRDVLRLAIERDWHIPTQINSALIADDSDKIDSITKLLESRLTRVLTEQVKFNQVEIKCEQPVLIEKDLPIISHFIPDFLSWDERSRTPKIINACHQELKLLICVIGDLPVNQVTKDDIQSALKIKALMPYMSRKPYKDWGLEETVNKIKSGYEVELDDVISSKTVKETLKCYQSFFSSFLPSKDKDFTSTPTKGVRVIWESIPYADYSDTQMTKIVEYCKSQSMTDKNMVILVGAYTGMRLSEICNITKESVKVDEDSGYTYLIVKKGKTKAAARKIPISKKLESIGFLGYLDKLKSKEKIFNKKTDLINEELRKIRDILNIPHENEFEQRRVFHSLRHSFITKARAKGVTDVQLQKVVGHEIPKSITDRYTHGFSVKDLAYIVEVVDW